MVISYIVNQNLKIEKSNQEKVNNGYLRNKKNKRKKKLKMTHLKNKY